ncbi:hypothetical protein [Helicobacter sp. 12S02232-10]|nr:hypothetical protein [Helicobacter sp. 12S02232-10]
MQDRVKGLEAHKEVERLEMVIKMAKSVGAEIEVRNKEEVRQ